MNAAVVVFGNCQAQIISAMMNGLLTDGHRTVYVPSAVSIGPIEMPKETGDHCVVLVEQIGVEQAFPFNDRLSSRVRRVRFPSLNLLSLWPFSCHDHRNTTVSRESPFGRYPYGDRIALQVWREGYRGREAVTRYLEASTRAMVDVIRLLDLELARGAMIEVECDVNVIDHIKDNFRSSRLFNTQNHPSRQMIFQMLKMILQDAALKGVAADGDRIGAYERFFFSEANMWRPFENYQQPVHPEVARRLGLEWWREDLLYFVDPLGRAVTHDQFFEWYLSEWSS